MSALNYKGEKTKILKKPVLGQGWVFLFCFRNAAIAYSDRCLTFPQLYTLFRSVFLHYFPKGLCQMYLTAPKAKASRNAPKEGFL